MRFFDSLPLAGRRLSLVLLLPFLAAGLLSCGDDNAAEESPDPDASAEVRDVEIWNLSEGVGPTYTYSMLMTIDQTATIEGSPMSSMMSTDGTVRMRMTDSSAEGTTWTAIMNMSLSGTAAGTDIPNTMQEQRVRYRIDPEGKVLDVAMQSEDALMDETIQQVLQSVNERQNAAQFFMQKEWSERSVGESWEETITDTVRLDSIAFQGMPMEGKLDLTFLIRTRYTYRGEVDTLGMTMIRIDSDVLEMTVAGEIVTDAVSMVMKSSGTGTGTGYFDPATKLYTVSLARQMMKTSMDIPAMGMSMPMDQVMTLRSVRTDLVGEGRDAAAAGKEEESDPSVE